jgi:hypothetical protein
VQAVHVSWAEGAAGVKEGREQKEKPKSRKDQMVLVMAQRHCAFLQPARAGNGVAAHWACHRVRFEGEPGSSFVVDGQAATGNVGARLHLAWLPAREMSEGSLSVRSRARASEGGGAEGW